MRNRSFLLLSTAVLISCASDPVAPAPAPAPSPAPAAAPAPSPAPAPGPVPDGATVDLTDPAADAICAEVAARPHGAFTADPAFDVTGTVSVAGVLETPTWLSLAFDWPATRYEDAGHPWRLDARSELAIEILNPQAGVDAFAEVGIPTAVRVWSYPKLARACTDVALDRDDEDRSQYGSALDATATLTISKRSDALVEGTVVSKGEDGVESKLAFSAPLVGSFAKDTTVCCLKAR